MRVTLYLYSSSVDNSIRFYVDELALFTISENYGTGYCLLQSTLLPGFYLYLVDWCIHTEKQYALSLDVPDCDAEFRRMISTTFTSGGRIAPDESGNVEVLEYPGGKVFQMADPDNNVFAIYEHFKGEDES